METLSAAALKNLARLRAKKYRRREGRFLVEGARLAREALESPCQVELAIVEEGTEGNWMELLARVGERGGKAAVVPKGRLAKLADTVTPQGIVLEVAAREFTPEGILALRGGVTLLDRIGDPGNVGAILRSAWAFGLSGALFLPGTAEARSPKVLRASMGGAFRIPIAEDVEPGRALELLRGHGYVLVAAKPRDGEPLARARLAPRTAFLIGSEARGLSADLAAGADLAVTIEQDPGAESLNAAVAAGILFHRWRLDTYGMGLLGMERNVSGLNKDGPENPSPISDP